jgi:hypothetical protein
VRQICAGAVGVALLVGVMAPVAAQRPTTRRTYSGPLELGEDLMVIEVGNEIAVRRPKAAQR